MFNVLLVVCGAQVDQQLPCAAHNSVAQSSLVVLGVAPRRTIQCISIVHSLAAHKPLRMHTISSPAHSNSHAVAYQNTATRFPKASHKPQKYAGAAECVCFVHGSRRGAMCTIYVISRKCANGQEAAGCYAARRMRICLVTVGCPRSGGRLFQERPGSFP